MDDAALVAPEDRLIGCISIQADTNTILMNFNSGNFH